MKRIYTKWTPLFSGGKSTSRGSAAFWFNLWRDWPTLERRFEAVIHCRSMRVKFGLEKLP